MCNFFIRRKKIEDHYRWPTRSHSIQIIPLVCVIATKTLVTRFYAFHYLIKQILTFYDNSNFVFFFNFRKKRKLDFINFFFLFFLFLFYSIPRIPTPIPHVPTLIPRIPTLIPRIPIIPLILFLDSPFRLLQIAFYRYCFG